MGGDSSSGSGKVKTCARHPRACGSAVIRSSILSRGLRLFRLGRLGLEPVDEGLQMRALGLLLLGRRRLHGARLGAARAKAS
jgi:hypothetical protein